MKIKLKVEDQVKIFLTSIIVILMLSITGIYFYYEDNVKETWSNSYHLGPVFNTVVSYRLYSPNSKRKELTKEANELLVYYHRLFDRHNEEDYYIDDDESKGILYNLKSINDIYGTNKTIQVDEDLANILLIALEHGEKSDGYFNIAVGELSSLWSTYIEQATSIVCVDESCQPSKEVIEELVTCTPSIHELKEILIITKKDEKYYVKFDQYKDCEKVSLTLGGIAKGYAFKQIGDYFNDKGYLTLFNAQSSSYFNRYQKGLENVVNNIVDPKAPSSGIAFSFKGIKSLGSSTSGDYEQGYYVKENGKTIRRHHILNPLTGYSENYYHSISAYLDDPLVADILTTTLFNLDFEESYKLYLEYKKDYPELEVAWIRDTSIIASDGIFDKIEVKGNYSLIKASLEGGK